MGLLYVECGCHSRLGRPEWARLVWCVIALALAIVMVRGEAEAAEWSAAPTLGVKGMYNSNLLLNQGNNEVFGHWITPAVKFKGATDTLSVESDTRAEFVHYYGDQDRAFTNLYFPLRTSYRSDRHTFGFEGGFTRDNTLMGELQQTGLVLRFTQRNMWTAIPSWRVGITQRLAWQSRYQFVDTTYQDARRLGLADYRVHGGTTGLTYNVSLRDQVQLTGEYAFVRIPAVGLTTTYYGVQGGWTHDFGHQLIGTASGGGRLVNSDQTLPGGGSFASQEVVWVYSASLSKQFERDTVRIEGSREINPSGFGRLLRTDRVGGTLVHNLSETLSGSLSGNLYFVSGIGPTPSVVETRFFSVNPSVSWRFAQWWGIDVSYTYSQRAVDQLDQRNDSHSTFVMLTYGGPKWSVSR